MRPKLESQHVVTIRSPIQLVAMVNQAEVGASAVRSNMLTTFAICVSMFMMPWYENFASKVLIDFWGGC